MCSLFHPFVPAELLHAEVARVSAELGLAESDGFVVSDGSGGGPEDGLVEEFAHTDALAVDGRQRRADDGAAAPALPAPLSPLHAFTVTCSAFSLLSEERGSGSGSGSGSGGGSAVSRRHDRDPLARGGGRPSAPATGKAKAGRVYIVLVPDSDSQGLLGELCRALLATKCLSFLLEVSHDTFHITVGQCHRCVAIDRTSAPCVQWTCDWTRTGGGGGCAKDLLELSHRVCRCVPLPSCFLRSSVASKVIAGLNSSTPLPLRFPVTSLQFLGRRSEDKPFAVVRSLDLLNE